MRTRHKKFHAVVKADSDEHIGIFTDWTICSKHVLHVSGARYKGTHSLQEAIDILHLEGIDSPNIFHKGKVYNIQEFSNLPIDPINPKLDSDHTVATPSIVPVDMLSLAPDIEPEDFETSVVEQAYNVAQWISEHDDNALWVESLDDEELADQEYPLFSDSEDDILDNACQVTNHQTEEPYIESVGQVTNHQSEVSFQELEVNEETGVKMPINHDHVNIQILKEAEDAESRHMSQVRKKRITKKKISSPRRKSTTDSFTHVSNKLMALEASLLDLNNNALSVAEAHMKIAALQASIVNLSDDVRKISMTNNPNNSTCHNCQHLDRLNEAYKDQMEIMRSWNTNLQSQVLKLQEVPMTKMLTVWLPRTITCIVTPQ